jgi:DNA-binding CsgD family transcriptional regulator
MQIDDGVAAMLGGIYDTALEPGLWPDTVERLCRLLNFYTGGVWIADDDTREVSLDIAWNEDPEVAPAFYGHIIHMVPDAYFYPTLPAGSIYSCEGCYGPGEFEKSAVYNDYFLPFHYGSDISAVIWRQASRAARFCMKTHLRAEKMSEDENAILGFLLPHFRRAIEVQQSLGLLDAQRRAALEFVDGLPVGVVFLDRRGRVLEANREARAIAAGSDGFRLDHDQVRGGTPSQCTALSRLIGGALATTLGDGADSGGSLRLDRPSLRRAYEVLVSPLNGKGESLTPVNGAAAVLVITDPEHHAEPPHERLQRLYGLSPAEAWGIASGKRQTELAAERGISPETVRTYLRRARDKTDVKRTADLVRLILTGPAMLNGNGD